MATLREIAEDYHAASALCRIGLEDAKAAGDEVTAKLLRAMLLETRDLRHLCETYYALPRNGKYSMGKRE